MTEPSEKPEAVPDNPLLRLSPVLSKLATLVVVAFLCLLLQFAFQPTLKSLEERFGALGWTLAPDTTPEERFTLVVIDERSIAEVGPWPWQREDMAKLVTAIDAAGVQLQLHDITYPESRPGDESFLSALATTSGVIISQTPALQDMGSTPSVGLLTHPFTGVECGTSNGGIDIPVATGFVGSATAFAGVAKGHTVPIIDSDGAVRRTPALVCYEGIAYPAFAIAAFLQLSSAEQWSGAITAGNALFGPPASLSLQGYPGLNIPLDRNGGIRVSFDQSPDSFQAVSAIDVIDGNVESSLLESTWALVGVTAFGTGDIVPTPYSGASFGVEIQARLLASLLDADIPFTPSGAPVLLFFVAGLFAAVSYGLARAGDRVAAYGLPVAAICLPLAALGLHSWLLAISNIWLGWVVPALFGLLATSALLLLELARTRLERSRVFGNLNSYLPTDVARDIAFSLPTSRVNAQRRDVTLLNADLRNFSAFGEARPPEEIAAVLHYFFTRATEIIERCGGRVQEFQGDSLLALWEGAGHSPALHALNSARKMQRALNYTLLPAQALNGLEPLALGIGIEQGPVLIGSIGPAHRRSHTLLGDTVGITLRIQEMTAELAQPILVGASAARQLSGEKLESQGSYLLSGLRIPQTLFAPSEPPVSIAPRRETQPKLAVVSGGRL